MEQEDFSRERTKKRSIAARTTKLVRNSKSNLKKYSSSISRDSYIKSLRKAIRKLSKTESENDLLEHIEIDQFCANMELDDGPMWIEIFSSDSIVLYSALKKINEYLGTSNQKVPYMPSPVDVMQRSHPTVLQKIVDLLYYEGHTALQYQALCCLRKVCSSTSVNISAVVKAGAIRPLLNLIEDPECRDPRFYMEAVDTISLISGDNGLYRGAILDARGVQILVNLTLSTTSPGVRRTCSRALFNIFGNEDATPSETRKAVIPAIINFLYETSESVLIESCLVICAICISNDTVEEAIKAGIVPRLAELLRHRSTTVRKAVLIACDAVITSREINATALAQLNVLPALSELLVHDSGSIRKRACALLSTLISGGEHFIRIILEKKENSILQRLKAITLTNDNNISLWASSALANAVLKGTTSQQKFLIQNDLIDVLKSYYERRKYIMNADIVREALVQLTLQSM